MIGGVKYNSEWTCMNVNERLSLLQEEALASNPVHSRSMDHLPLLATGRLTLNIPR
jgi:hypothetical protein